MTTYKTAELEGALLDAAVAIAEGFKPIEVSKARGCVISEHAAGWVTSPYSSSWGLAGPIIDRERIDVTVSGDNWRGTVHLWRGPSDDEGDFFRATETGPTPLIAACRAYVLAKLGETVELP